jgi:RNA polymerase-binding protein DksA
VTRQELDKYRKQLADLGEQLRGHVKGLADEAFHEVGGEASGNLSNAPLHLADLASEHQTRETALELVANDREILSQIGDALTRIEAGTYGRCERCGQDIPAGRLQAVPYAALCVACAGQAESEAPAPAAGVAP